MSLLSCDEDAATRVTDDDEQICDRLNADGNEAESKQKGK